ncbi:hypothetical protein [Virgibacillus sp. SK37]|nr:hypothetical protein [Virgibacillus sp. SK37]AIF45308.1 hypothetical protein X953_06875 [Virgibacillus sp. SK37]
MNLKRFLSAILTGYLLMALIVYLFFDYFSLGLTVGFIFGVILLALITTVLRKRIK